MKRSVTIPKGYADAWARLFARSPAELEAERASRQPAPAPRTPNAQEGPKFALQRTQMGWWMVPLPPSARNAMYAPAMPSTR